MWWEFHEILFALQEASYCIQALEKQFHLMCFEFVWSTLLFITFFSSWVMRTEFWKQIPPNEPYRVVLGDVRDKLYNTRERSRQLLANGKSDIPEDSIFTNAEQVPSLPITFSLRKFRFSIPVYRFYCKAIRWKYTVMVHVYQSHRYHILSSNSQLLTSSAIILKMKEILRYWFWILLL